MTDIIATSHKPVVILDRDLIIISVFCLIGLFVSLALMLLLPADDVAALLLQMS
jgi:hypothetical protein